MELPSSRILSLPPHRAAQLGLTPIMPALALWATSGPSWPLPSGDTQPGGGTGTPQMPSDGYLRE